ncbi:MAG: dihydroneopterin aldolase [Actinomycetota bacterium]
MSDTMRITGIEALGYHGVFDVERQNGQPFIVDVELKLDLEKAGKSDDLNDSIDYNDVAILIHNEIIGTPVKLIEALAERISEKIMAAYPTIEKIKTTVHKPRAPISVAFGGVSVTIKRER